MSFAEEIAQAALRGWFGDPDGFKNMQEGNNKKAVREVTKVLVRHFSWRNVIKVLVSYVLWWKKKP